MMELVQRLVASGQKIEAVRGVVNGTSNFVLEQLATGQSLQGAVREAQEKGFAEADPSADLDGIDAARKIEILSRLAWGEAPQSVKVTGIHDFTPVESESVLTCRLVANARRGHVEISPEWLPDADYLAHTRGAENRLEVSTADGTVHRVSGLGAGRYPTATAVIADLIDCALDPQAC
jgi:homoserine dehydrogenase